MSFKNLSQNVLNGIAYDALSWKNNSSLKTELFTAKTELFYCANGTAKRDAGEFRDSLNAVMKKNDEFNKAERFNRNYDETRVRPHDESRVGQKEDASDKTDKPENECKTDNDEAAVRTEPEQKSGSTASAAFPLVLNPVEGNNTTNQESEPVEATATCEVTATCEDIATREDTATRGTDQHNNLISQNLVFHDHESSDMIGNITQYPDTADNSGETSANNEAELPDMSNPGEINSSVPEKNQQNVGIFAGILNETSEASDQRGAPYNLQGTGYPEGNITRNEASSISSNTRANNEENENIDKSFLRIIDFQEKPALMNENSTTDNNNETRTLNNNDTDTDRFSFQGSAPNEESSSASQLPLGENTHVLNQTQFNSENAFIQDIKTRILSQQATPDNEILAQFLENAKIYLSEEKTEMVIVLKPESLGKLTLKIVTEDGILMGRFIAENQHVKQILESNMQFLRESLEKQGLNVQGFSVALRQDADGREGYYRNDSYNNPLGYRKNKKILPDVLNTDLSIMYGYSDDTSVAENMQYNKSGDSYINITA